MPTIRATCRVSSQEQNEDDKQTNKKCRIIINL